MTMSDKSDTNDNSSRKLRKFGEKVRRDKLRTLLAQLAEENPWSATSEKRVDKAGILKLTVSFLKFHHGIKKFKIAEGKGASHLSPRSIQTCLDEALNGFLMIVSEKENIVFVSSSVTKVLGHHQVDVVGSDISHYVHSEDVELFRKQLVVTTNNIQTHTVQSKLTKLGGSSFEGLNSSWDQDRSFYVRMVKVTDKNCAENKYELVHFKGHLKVNQQKSDLNGKYRESVWLIAVGRPVSSEIINEIPTLYCKNDEFVTQFDLYGNILFSDHRSALVLCKMPSDSIGKSCYLDVYKEDLPAVSHAHTQIMKIAITVTVFRLKIHKNRCCYIMSRSVVARDSWTNEPKFIVSLNIALSEDEGKRLLEEQRKNSFAFVSDQKEELTNHETPCDDAETDISKNRNKSDILLENTVNSSVKSDSLNSSSVNCTTTENCLPKAVCSSVEETSLKRSLSFDDCEVESNEEKLEISVCDVGHVTESHPKGYQTLEISLDEGDHVSRKTESVLKRLLLFEDVHKTKDTSSMDLPKSQFKRYSYDEDFRRSNSNRTDEDLSRFLHKSPNLHNMSSGNLSNNEIGNIHGQNFSVFNTNSRHLINGEPFPPLSKECVSSSQSQMGRYNNAQSDFPLSMPHPFKSTPASGFSSMNSVNRVYPSTLYTFPNYSDHFSSQNYPFDSCSSYSRDGNNILPDTSYDHGITGQKNFTVYPFYGADSKTSECMGPVSGYGSGSGENTSSLYSDMTSQSVSSNNGDDSFDSFSYDPTMFGSKAIAVSDYLGDYNSYNISLDRSPDDNQYNPIVNTQRQEFHHSSKLPNLLGKYNSSTDNRSTVDTSASKLGNVKVQSPTVDSVTSPSGDQKTEDKELQIQIKLSQQLHSKQNLIGHNLTNQREELEKLKAQLKEAKSANGQYLALLKRLSDLEKEIQEQDSILTDLREQSSVKIQQLMYQE